MGAVCLVINKSDGRKSITIDYCDMLSFATEREARIVQFRTPSNAG